MPIGFQSRAIPWTNPELHGGRNSCRSMQTPSNTGPMHGNPEQFQCQSLTYSMPIFLSPQIKQSNPSQSMPIRVPVHANHGRSSANPSQHFQATNDHPIFQSWPIHTNSGESSAIPRPFSRPFVPKRSIWSMYLVNSEDKICAKGTSHHRSAKHFSTLFHSLRI